MTAGQRTMPRTTPATPTESAAYTLRALSAQRLLVCVATHAAPSFVLLDRKRNSAPDHETPEKQTIIEQMNGPRSGRYVTTAGNDSVAATWFWGRRAMGTGCSATGQSEM